ncbi:concanavalin A-like lectin/glucanase domain-containing protein [Rhizophagus diaphanus]|nr:concanavalin A-like lectin/glucanase domain-containing protein [Rhizophagus diaphanus] [Rhizophagus sp. MUCL 43196]
MIEPLEIVPAKIILNIYRHNTKSNNFSLNDFRGTLYRTNESDCVWDETACGSKLIIEDNGKVIRAPKSLGSWRNVRAKMILENNGIYEWDVIIEKACNDSWIGIASENLNYEGFAGDQPNGWVLGSSGYCCNSNNYIKNYCQPFGDGARITVHLDMNKRTCAFAVNGMKYHHGIIYH